MGLRINSNLASLSVQRQLAKTTQAIGRALNRLSSGRRIASPREDLGGFSESVNLTSQIRGLRQGVLNINQSQALIESASSAISAQMDLVQKMRELAVQAANGTLTQSDRDAINRNLNSLLEEFQRITNDTSFGDLHLLDGSFGTKSIQVGGDGRQSIDLTGANLNSASVFSQTIGSGTFTAGSSGSVTGVNRNIESADVNNDGKLDLISVNTTTDIMSVQLGRGDGTFQTAITNDAGSNMQDIAIVDLNKDGILDIAGVDNANNALRIYLGNGDGTFKTATTIATGSGPTAIAAGDINKDGSIDLVTLDTTASTVSTFLGRGDGSFLNRTTTAIGGTATDIILKDMNGDGKLDIVTSHSGVASQAELSQADFGSDVVSDYNSKYIWLDNASGGKYYFWFDNGLGSDPNPGGTGYRVDTSAATDAKTVAAALAARMTAVFATTLISATSSGTKVSISNFLNGSAADISTNSGKITVSVTNQGVDASGISGIYLRSGNGSGAFTSLSTISSFGITQIRAGDLDGDGLVDIVGTRASASSIALYLNSSSFTYVARTALTTGSVPTNLELADINNDGLLDVISNSSTSNTLNLFLNAGGGTYGSRSTLTGLTSPYGIAVGDFNQDGAQDIASGITNSSYAYQLFMGRTTTTSGLSKFNLQSVQDATTLLKILDTASATLTKSQASLGALHNRLDFAASSNLLISDSLEEARSKVEDVDLALETSELVRNQILQQAQVAVYAQSNLQMQTVLELLKTLK